MGQSVYQRVLGSDFEKLSPQLRPYFTGDSAGRPGLGSGVFTVAGLRRRILAPVMRYLAFQRILFPEFARAVPFDVVNTPRPDGSLRALRTFHLPERDRPLEDTMRVVDGRLHDFMGRRGGLEVRMALEIIDGNLRMSSVRQWLHLGTLRVRIPQLATVSVAESWVDDHQHVDVRLRSPVIGEWFRYAGSFSYRYEER